MHEAKALVSILMGAVVGTSCAVGPDYRAPEIDVGSGWSEPHAAAETELDLSRWWTSFDDPVLERLIERALEQNLDVRQARARVAEARALRSATAGTRYPTADASASVTRQRLSENGPLPIDQIPGIERDQTIYEPRFDAYWELDLFGGTRRAIEAADARIEASVEQHLGARLTVAAETARSYLVLRGAQHELQARRAAVEATRSSVDLVRLQLEAGEVPEAALAQAEAELAAVEAGLPRLASQLRSAALSIGVLLGELPETELALLRQEPEYVELAPYPLGERADLLQRRPDVRAAERTLAAVTADVGVVTADRFPKISIGAGGGFQALDSANLFESASQTWAIAPLISWRVLDGGRVRAQVQAAQARVEIAALAYEQAVKRALTDAETALTRYDLGLEALARQRMAVDAARTSYGYATARYRAGDISLLELLDAERTLRSAEDTYARVHTQTATDLVALFKALGGGWGDAEQG